GGQHYIDVLYHAGAGTTLDYASIQGAGNAFSITGPGIGSLTISGTPVPIATVSTDAGVLFVPMALETIDGKKAITRYGPSRANLLQKAAAHANDTDAQLLAAATLLSGTHYDLRVENVNVSDGNGGFVTQRWVTELAKETVVTVADLPTGASDQDLWT